MILNKKWNSFSRMDLLLVTEKKMNKEKINKMLVLMAVGVR